MTARPRFFGFTPSAIIISTLSSSNSLRSLKRFLATIVESFLLPMDFTTSALYANPLSSVAQDAHPLSFFHIKIDEFLNLLCNSIMLSFNYKHFSIWCIMLMFHSRRVCLNYTCFLIRHSQWMHFHSSQDTYQFFVRSSSWPQNLKRVNSQVKNWWTVHQSL